MGYTANFLAVVALLPLPFAGYWLVAEIYAYSQQMGITLMGGSFAWLFITQAVIIGALFLSANYYLWCGMERSHGAHRYTGYIKYIAAVILLCFLVWFTPHTLILTPAELKALGGQYHPFLGPLGIMPAKNTAVNIMLIFTFLSFLLYRRANLVAVVSWARQGSAVQAAIIDARDIEYHRSRHILRVLHQHRLQGGVKRAAGGLDSVGTGLLHGDRRLHVQGG